MYMMDPRIAGSEAHSSMRSYNLRSMRRAEELVLGGEFRQVLPVVPRGTREQVVAALLGRSRLWHNISLFKLSTNMRELTCCQSGEAEDAAAQQGFSWFHFRIGDRREPVPADLGDYMIHVPPAMYAATDKPIWTQFLGQRSPGSGTAASWCRGILTAKNTDVDALDDRALQISPGQVCFPMAHSHSPAIYPLTYMQN